MATEMKDSGIAWIGEIPEHWNTRRLTKAGRFVKGKLPNESNIEQKGLPIIGASEMLGKNARTYTTDLSIPLCSNEDILILWDGANAGITASRLNGVVSSTVVKYTVTNNELDSRYVAYLYKYAEIYFREKVTGTTNPHMSIDFINDFPLLVPPFDEQEKIAAFLDKKCGEIDELVDLETQMIDELKAYKQSVITEAVTHGLNPDVPMKDSGIEWIGEIPEHWEVHKIKTLMTNKSVNGYPDEEVLSLYRDYGVIPKSSRTDNHNVTSEDTNNYKFVEIGDFVINKMKAWQGSMAISNYQGIISPAYYVCRITSNNISKEYIHYLLRNESYKPEYLRLSTGLRVGQWDLNINDFLNIPMIYPDSIDEQEQIAAYLDEKCADIDALIALRQEKIETLKEYKKSVIFEYVTGKKQVV